MVNFHVSCPLSCPSSCPSSDDRKNFRHKKDQNSLLAHIILSLGSKVEAGTSIVDLKWTEKTKHLRL